MGLGDGVGRVSVSVHKFWLHFEFVACSLLDIDINSQTKQKLLMHGLNALIKALKR